MAADGLRFRALDIERDIAAAPAWNDPVAAKLWLYHLHYFDDLIAKNFKDHRKLHQAFIARWIAENPPAGGNGWEPYPTSVRTVNWIKWALLGGELPHGAFESLAVQVRFLSHTLEYHLLGNHLLTNAKALVFAGLFFDGPEAQRWLWLGEKILTRELPEQILADGGHFELSTTYHAIVTEDVLDLINLTRTFGHKDRFDLPAIAARMLTWQAAMTRPDGLPPHFNDSSYDAAPTLAETVAYGQRLGIIAQRPGDRAWLAASGYVRMERGPFTLFADLGEIGPSYLPGHGHCDMLSFELSVDGEPVFVNTGTSTYEAGPRRMLERGTAAHNTVQVGGMEQSEIWGTFRVGRRAHPREVRVDANSAEAWHDGYARLGVRHHRRFHWSGPDLLISDGCEGRQVPAVAYFHLAPGLVPIRQGDTVSVGALRVRFNDYEAISIEDYSWSPRFNCHSPAQRLCVRFNGLLTTTISMV